MSLEEQIRQLLVIHVYGTHGDTADPAQRAANQRLYGAATPAQVVAAVRPGGVIFIERNPQDSEAADLSTGNLTRIDQVANLSASLQHAARANGPGLGLLIATDQENGPVTRLPGDHRSWPGGAELGEADDPELARNVARSTGKGLAQAGININLAPVADVDTNPDNPVIGDRAFSSDPSIVSSLVAAQVEGYLGANISPTVKHFPGHGDASADSHTDLPVIDLDRQTWETVHLAPFRAGIAAGAPLVMTGHISAPALDPSGTPATLSRPIVTDLLRDDLDFGGLVITDALWMRGVRETASDSEIAVEALRAGSDLLLMPPDVEGAVSAVLDAVEDRRLTKEHLEESTRRVLTLKAAHDLLP